MISIQLDVYSLDSMDGGWTVEKMGIADFPSTREEQ